MDIMHVTAQGIVAGHPRCAKLRHEAKSAALMQSL